jgi:hypothetical protein
MEMSREQYQHEDTTNKPPTSHVMESSGIWMLLLLFFSRMSASALPRLVPNCSDQQRKVPWTKNDEVGPNDSVGEHNSKN